MNIKKSLLIATVIFSSPLYADRYNDQLVIDSAVGGALGGALGGAVGALVGDREGAIVGSGIGAAAGTAINTEEYRDSSHSSYPRVYAHQYKSYSGRFCPPGQAKKGRC